MRYQIVRSVGNRLTSETYEDRLALIAACTRAGNVVTGEEQSRRLRPELIGQPTFAGMLGPMWNGDGVRYEDGEAYRTLSA